MPGGAWRAFACIAPPELQLIERTDAAHQSDSDRGVRLRRFHRHAQQLLRNRTYKPNRAVRGRSALGAPHVERGKAAAQSRS